MEITDIRIDDGKAFDWGKTSKEYQNTGIFIQRNSIEKSWIEDYA